MFLVCESDIGLLMPLFRMYEFKDILVVPVLLRILVMYIKGGNHIDLRIYKHKAYLLVLQSWV